MKIEILSLAAIAGSVSAFAPPGFGAPRPATTSILRSTTTAESSTTSEPFFASETVDGDSSDEGVSIYDKIGFAKESVALGIDPEEVYDYLGGRDGLISKFMSDVPKFDKARATLEVDKFMMDAEMVNAVIQYQKQRRNSGGAVPMGGAGGEISPVQEYGTYALFIGGGVGIAEVKSAFIDHTQSLPFEHFFHSVADRAEVVAGVADTVVDPSAVQMTVEGAAAAAAIN